MAKKPTAQARPMIGTGSLQLLAHIAHGIGPQVRASSGLATALHSLYAAKLEEAEADTERLGKRCDDDAGAAYTRQCHHTQELRGVVAILETLDDTLENAARRASRMEELTRRCKGGCTMIPSISTIPTTTRTATFTSSGAAPSRRRA